MTPLVDNVGNESIVSRAEALARALDRASDDDEPPSTSDLFDPDFDRLRSAGLYTPNMRSERLSLELRSVKRRLLRRLGLRHATGDRRLRRRSGRQRNLVLVTSTRPGEGKTFCAANLALSLAFEEEIDTLLVDADFARPKIRALFGLPARPGLADRLRDPSLSVSALCVRVRHSRLSILTEGVDADRAGALFSSVEVQRALVEMSSRRADRLVIIDAPPVLSTEEAGFLAREADEILFVVEAGATPQPAVATALDELLDVNPNVSLILNRCLIGAGANYYGSYEDYGRKNSGAAAPQASADGGEDE